MAEKPFKERRTNNISVFNELINLMCAYWLMQINDVRYEPPTVYHIGEWIVVFLYFSWSSNALSIIYFVLKLLIRKARRYYLQKVRWKIACLRPKKVALTTNSSTRESTTLTIKIEEVKKVSSLDEGFEYEDSDS